MTQTGTDGQFAFNPSSVRRCIVDLSTSRVKHLGVSTKRGKPTLFRIWKLMFGIYLLFGIWILGFFPVPSGIDCMPKIFGL